MFQGSPALSQLAKRGLQERALEQASRASSANEARAAQRFRLAAQKSVELEKRPRSKRGKKKKKKKPLYRRPKRWEECWVDVRKRQDVFDQKWKTWPSSRPTRAATLFGTCLYVKPRDKLASNGWCKPSRTVCLGETNELKKSVPPEWLTAPPAPYEAIIEKASAEENWLLEVSVERKMKALCKQSNALEIFGQYDADGSGELDGDEFRQMMAHIGEDLSEQKAEWLLSALDPSGDGTVDFDEFRQFIERRDRVGISQSVEFCGVYKVDFKESLLRLYDPKKMAPKFHPLYTLKALCKRESLKFEPCIRKHLNYLWKEIDEDKSGKIEYDERCCEMIVALTPKDITGDGGCGLPPSLLTRDGSIHKVEHEKLAQEDWGIDHHGMGFLDYERFVSCWFQIADQFTDRIALKDYDAFLGRCVKQLYPTPPPTPVEASRPPTRTSVDSALSILDSPVRRALEADPFPSPEKEVAVEVEVDVPPQVIEGVMEELSYELWLRALGGALDAFKDEDPARYEAIYASLFPKAREKGIAARAKQIVARVARPRPASAPGRVRQQDYLDLNSYALQIQRVWHGKGGRAKWKARLARWQRRSQDLLTSALRLQASRRGIMGRRAADAQGVARGVLANFLREAYEAMQSRKMRDAQRDIEATYIQCFLRRARARQVVLLARRRRENERAGPPVCDLAALDTFVKEESLQDPLDLFPVFAFVRAPDEVRPVVAKEPLFDAEAEKRRIREELRLAEEALELDRTTAAYVSNEAMRAMKRRAKERLERALEAFTRGRAERIVAHNVIKYVIAPARERKRRALEREAQRRGSRASKFHGGYGSDAEEVEEPAPVVVEARPQIMTEEVSGMRLFELQVRPSDAERERAFVRQAVARKTQDRVDDHHRELEKGRSRAKTPTKKKRGLLSLPRVVGAESPPEDSRMAWKFARAKGAAVVLQAERDAERTAADKAATAAVAAVKRDAMVTAGVAAAERARTAPRADDAAAGPARARDYSGGRFAAALAGLPALLAGIPVAPAAAAPDVAATESDAALMKYFARGPPDAGDQMVAMNALFARSKTAPGKKRPWTIKPFDPALRPWTNSRGETIWEPVDKRATAKGEPAALR